MIAEFESTAAEVSAPSISHKPGSNPPVKIRCFVPEDAPALYDATRESISALSSWMTWCSPNYSLEDSHSFVWNSDRDWKRGERYSFAIIDSGKGSLLGSVGLSHLNGVHRHANLGYWVRTSRSGHGIAPAAVRLAAQFAFDQLGLIRLELIVPLGNKPSQRVAEKVGAHCEGLLRKRLVINGKHHDAVLFSLLPEDLGDA